MHSIHNNNLECVCRWEYDILGDGMVEVCLGTYKAGFGISSLVFLANRSFIAIKRAKEWFALEKKQLAHGGSFVKSNGSDSLTVPLMWRATRANPSHCSLNKSNRAKSDGSDSLLGTKRGKAVKNIRKIRIFSSELLVFWESFPRITSKSNTSLFL